MDALNEGKKFDAGKPRYDLLPFDALDEVAGVLGHGATKYGEDNWRLVPDARKRYIAAALRHISAYQQGRERDEETGRHALAHAICSLLFIAALDLEEDAQAETLLTSKDGEEMLRWFLGGLPEQEPLKCNHSWFVTGAMQQGECRCTKCGQWGKV